MVKPICTPSTDNQWTEEKIKTAWAAISDLAINKYKLNLPDLAFEIHDRASLAGLLSADGGLPTWLPHWTTGQKYLKELNAFRDNGSAYRILEMIIHSNPCVCYLMAENTMIEQIMVMAHAAVGHADLFHNNRMFVERSHESNILSYMEYANKYITKCEEKHGAQVVETFLDAVLVWSNYAVDHNPSMRDGNPDAEEKLENYIRNNNTDYNRKLGIYKKAYMDSGDSFDGNIIRFIQKNNHRLAEWEYEILQIIRTLESYFYPYRRMKTMHEGWAMFWEKIICQDLFEMGLLDMKGYTEILNFANHHVRSTPLTFDGIEYGLTNTPDPYHYGLKLFEEIRRMCENPTEEDYQLYPRIAGTDWLTTCKDVAYNYRDQTFCSYFTTPRVAKDMGLMTLKGLGDYKWKVTSTQERSSWREMQKQIYDAYDPMLHIPDIEVSLDKTTDDELYLVAHKKYEGLDVDYDEQLDLCVQYLKILWKGRFITLKSTKGEELAFDDYWGGI